MESELYARRITAVEDTIPFNYLAAVAPLSIFKTLWFTNWGLIGFVFGHILLA